MLSKGNPSALAVVCFTAVKNDIGLNKPDNHNDIGNSNLSVQFNTCVYLSITS